MAKIKRLQKNRTYGYEELEELGFDQPENQRVVIHKKSGLSYIMLDVGNGCYSVIRTIRKP